jgi:uncharacterized membrane protein YgcG
LAEREGSRFLDLHDSSICTVTIVKFLLAGLLLLCGFVCASANAATYYIRSDGGTTAQCTGLADAPYSGSGSAQACAWHHPFDALPPQADTSSPPALHLHGSDTLIIGAGSYEIGMNAPGAGAYAACNAGWSWDCFLAAVPSGTAAQPTQILGAGYDSGCAAPPQLWGSEHAAQVMSLVGSSNVKVGCLEITDHSACIESHLGGNSPDACNRTSPPYGGWASRGIYAKDSSNVTLQDLNIHGMANRGILSGRLRDWTLTNVKLIANGWSGWDGDLGESAGSSDSGTMRFQNLEVGFNGCAEQYPGTNIYACWGQVEGGYGDGFGETNTSGNWIFQNSYFHHNTQDGLDMLYADTTATISVQQTQAEGNAGNQIKLAGAPTVQNSVIVGNCSYFSGKDYMSAGDQCRAMGNALVVSVQPSLKARIEYNTITSEGDCLILAINGNDTSSVAINNNALIGKPDWMKADQSPQPQSCLFYWDSGPSSWPVTYGGNYVWQVKDNACPAGNTCVDPQVTDAGMTTFNALPQATSPLINAANTSSTLPTDMLGQPRPSFGGYDVGAVEYQGSSTGTGGSGGGSSGGGGSGGGSGSTGGTPTASFSYTTNGLNVTFTDASTDSGGTLATHAWSFGDGTSSNVASPSHTFTAAGTYTVTETVTDSSNGKTSATSKSVAVSVPSGGGSGGSGGGCKNGHGKKCENPYL